MYLSISSKNNSLDCFDNRGRLIMLYRKKWIALQYANTYQINEQMSRFVFVLFDLILYVPSTIFQL